MSSLVESLIFAGLLTGADAWSTEIAKSRGGVEVGPIQNPYARAAVQMSLLTAADQAVQRIPHAKWPARVGAAILIGAVVKHNLEFRATVSW